MLLTKSLGIFVLNGLISVYVMIFTLFLISEIENIYKLS